jgi:CubicO group peptidase (beta-lactamase class C family)
MLTRVAVSKSPGNWEYQSGATQLLGMAIAKATGKSLAAYASEKLWQPMGAQHAAQWHLDSEDGTELAFCCFNSNARDFARFGKLMINHGKFDGQQILDSSFTHAATQPFAVPHYGHSFWIDDSFGTRVYYQRGVLGQYIIVIPEKDLVIVRLGHALKPMVDQHSEDFKTIVNEVIKDF